MEKIVFLDAETLGQTISLEPIRALGDLTVYQRTSPEEVFERIADCNVLIVNKIRMGKEQMEAAPGLRLICEAGTGVDNIDVECAQSMGIAVKNVTGYSTFSVTQTTFMHMLSLAGNARRLDEYVKSGEYTASGCFTDVRVPWVELRGRNLGIIGLGNIGSQVAAIAEAFGMNVAYHPTSGIPHSDRYRAMELTDLLSWGDFISIHAPKNRRTDNLIGYSELCRMKSSAFILNMGRGGIINEADLARAVDEGVIAGAGIDVYTTEPLPSDSPYMKMIHRERMSFTPHTAWRSAEASNALIKGIADNIRN